MFHFFSFYLSSVSETASSWIVSFLFFWLVEAPRRFWEKAIAMSLVFEKSWATYITFRNLFAPLYQDYSIIGRIIGPFFRLGRIVIGILIHLLLLLFWLFSFLIFCLVLWGSPIFFLINLFIWNQ
jgi:hypothetical protein